MFWRLTLALWRSVSTMAPIIATSRTRPASLEVVDVFRIEHEAEASVLVTPVGIGAAVTRLGATVRLITQAPTTSSISKQDTMPPISAADRQILDEALAQLGEVDVEHHDHEQEQHRHRADIDHDQDHRQELGAQQHEQPGRVDEGEDQEQHGMHRIAR
jgi:hypothetical protein